MRELLLMALFFTLKTHRSAAPSRLSPIIRRGWHRLWLGVETLGTAVAFTRVGQATSAWRKSLAETGRARAGDWTGQTRSV
jgi:hypothetical protein